MTDRGPAMSGTGTYDAIVVGCGPSGGMAAYHLASAGVSVLLLDREELPRYKPCGGGVTTKALQELPFPIDDVVEREINDAEILFGSPRGMVVHGRQIGKMVMRATFDHYLVRKAVEVGAEVRSGARVRSLRRESDYIVVGTDVCEFRARCVIGADGANGVVAKSLGLGANRAWGVAIEAEVDIDAEIVARQRVVFDFAALPFGYGYVFPKAQHLSVGLYTTLPTLSGLRERLDKYVAGNTVLSRGRIRSVVGHRVPLGRLSRPFHAAGVLLVGDAAGLGDPVWGEGISYALKSSRIAAEVLEPKLRSRSGLVTDLATYSQRITKEVGRELKFARLFAAVLYRLPLRVVEVLVQDRVVAEKMMDVLRGDSGYREYMKKFVGRLPAIVWGRMFAARDRPFDVR
jgi:geranylgeranyl reductase family protein